MSNVARGRSSATCLPARRVDRRAHPGADTTPGATTTMRGVGASATTRATLALAIPQRVATRTPCAIRDACTRSHAGCASEPIDDGATGAPADRGAPSTASRWSETESSASSRSNSAASRRSCFCRVPPPSESPRDAPRDTDRQSPSTGGTSLEARRFDPHDDRRRNGGVEFADGSPSCFNVFSITGRCRHPASRSIADSRVNAPNQPHLGSSTERASVDAA